MKWRPPSMIIMVIIMVITMIRDHHGDQWSSWSPRAASPSDDESYHEQGDLTGPLPSVVVATHQDKAITGRFVFFLVMMILNVILSSMIIVMIIYHNWWICSGGTPQTSRSSQQAPTRPQLYGHFPQSNHDHHPIMIMIIIIKTLFTLIVVVSQYFGNLCQKLSILWQIFLREIF